MIPEWKYTNSKNITSYKNVNIGKVSYEFKEI